MSRKRILPALILAGFVGFLGVHRLYAGRYVTGLLQLALFVPGAAMLCSDLAGIESVQTIDQLQDWVLHYQFRPLPWLLVLIPSFWALYDCALLALSRFRDGDGEIITRWV